MRGVSAGVQRQEHEKSFKELNQLRQLTTSSLRSEAGSPFKPNHRSAQSETSGPVVRNSQSTWAKFTIPCGFAGSTQKNLMWIEKKEKTVCVDKERVNACRLSD